MLLQAVVLHLDLTFLASYNNASLICSIFITHKEIHLRFTCSKTTHVLKCIAPRSSHDNSSLKLTPIFLIHTLFMKLLLIKLALKSPRKKKSVRNNYGCGYHPTFEKTTLRKLC